ncbi:metallophosphoesterase family protein [Marinibacterium sp. SX1]|uniref:metallophosphoesterase family protein n=1 Tax=Marinibacterium sp. SX1 TaxID=3388424 RepID=UPI003D17BC25
MEFRFIHSSDLHLGKGFGTMAEDLRGRLIEARHEVIARLAGAARAAGAGHILLAGDTFDTTGPSEGVRRQAARAMAAAEDLTWWVLPGNHDNLQGEELWRLFRAEAGPRVHLLTGPEPVEIAPGAWLLPAPLARQFPGMDLTAPMDSQATPEGALRLGLAHGGVTSFGEDFDSAPVIAPDRATRAGLDYLALGDWHGQLSINDRTWFSGTPESDRFRHAGRGSCLSVVLPGPGAPPQVTPVETGRFHWSAPALDLTPQSDAVAAFDALLDPDRAARRDQLLRIEAGGFLGMAARGALEDAAAQAAPDHAFFQLRTAGLRTEYAPDDLDLIASGGALRRAADALRAEAAGEGPAEARADVAQAALNRLWSLVREG